MGRKFKSLRTKISSIYIVLICFIALIGIISILFFWNLSTNLEGLMAENYKTINALTNMEEALRYQDDAVLNYLNSGKNDSVQNFSKNSTEFLKWHQQEMDSSTDEKEKRILKEIKDNYGDYQKSFSNMQDKFKTGTGKTELREIYYNDLLVKSRGLSDKLKQVMQINQITMLNEKKFTTRTAYNSIYFILILSLISILTGTILSRYLSYRFLNPLKELTESIRNVRAGNLNQKVAVITNDEIGELTREFNSMTHKLYQYEKSSWGKLIAEKNRFAAIIRSIADPLIVLDNEMNIRTINAAAEKFFNINERTVRNKHYRLLIKEKEKNLTTYIEQAIKGQIAGTNSLLEIKRDRNFYYDVVVAPYKDAKTKVVGYIVLLRNVTELKELEKTKTNFLSTISHEFKTPLTSILMGTSILLDFGLGELNEEQKEVISTLKEDGERLSALVNDLLELTRIESGKAVYHFEKSNIKDIINNSLKIFHELIKHKKINLELDIQENIPDIKADFEKITWVINNLISNALKYMGKNEKIRITAKAKGEFIEVSVEDTGMGIPEELQEIIFERFVQINDAQIEVRGTGVGLAVAKEIVEAHGGSIRCESILDKGSAFIFRLPINNKFGG